MKEKEILRSILGGYFKHHLYFDAVVKFQIKLKESDYYSDSWGNVRTLIHNRKLEEFEPLELMNVDANLPLDDNTDTEAYQWLDLMIKNIEEEDKSKILPY